MDLGSLLFGTALLVLVAAFVGKPLLDGVGELNVGAPDRELSSLLARRDQIISTLQELDMDYAVDKLDDHDYRVQRTALVEEGARVLRSVDQLSDLPPSIDPAQVGDLEAQLEVEIRQARRQMKSDDLPAGNCPACGSPVERGDSFCTACGEMLAAQGSGS